MTTGWYRTGTVAVAHGANAVTGTGTSWITNGIAAGDVFTADFANLYEVQAISGEGALALDRPYAGPSASGAGYAIIHNFSPLSATLLAAVNSLIATYTAGTQPYELEMFLPGAPAAAQIVYRRIFAITVNLPPGLTGSLARAGVAATAGTSFTIQKNGANIGAILFGAGATVPTFSLTAAVSFLAGDILSIVAPATPDPTLAEIALVLLGSVS